MNLILSKSFSPFGFKPEKKFLYLKKLLKHYRVLVFLLLTPFTITKVLAQGALTPPCITYSTPQVYTVNNAISILGPTNNCGAVPANTYGKVSTLAGSGTAGFSNNTNGALAKFNHLYGAVTDAAGNVYVADNLNYVIRKITPAGAVSTFAGSGTQGNVNGTGTGASFGGPVALTIDGSGNLYVSDYQVSIDNYLLKKITPSGVVSTIMTAPAKTFAMAVDAQNNLYTAGDPYNQVYKITPAGVVSNITSGGSFNGITGIAVDKSGTVYLADRNNNQIKKITTAGVVSVLAGSGAVGYADGTGSGAIFQNPNGVVLDASGNVYVSDQNVYTGGQVTSALIRKITPQGVVTTIAGKMGGPLTGDGVGAAAGLVDMVCLTIDANGNMYSTETNAVRKIVLTGYTISPALPSGLNFDGTTGIISGTPTAPNPATNYAVTGYNAAGSNIATVNITIVTPPCITYNTPQVYTVNNAIAPLVPTNNCGAVPASTYSKVSTLAGSGTAGFSNNTNGALATFNHLYGAVTDAAGNVYVADNLNYVIRKITPAGAVSTFAGSGTQGNVNGTGTGASFGGPVALTIDGLGNLYVSDYQVSIDNYLLKKITPSGVVSTIMTAPAKTFAMAVDAQNNLYTAGDPYNQVYKITPAGVVTNITSGGSFNGITGIAVDKSGTVYLADRNNNQIKKITTAGVVSVLAGSGAVGYADGTGSGAIFQNPNGVVLDASGNVYVSDQNVYTGGQVTSALIRKITPQGVVTTIAGKMGGPLTGDGVGAAAGLVDMVCLTIDANGNMYSTETNAVRKIVLTGYTISPALPSGLNFDGTTGIISGTPTAPSPATNYTITGFNVAGGSVATVNITVVGAPCITYNTPQVYTVNNAISILGPTNNCGAVPANTYGKVSTLAGSGTAGFSNNTNGALAKFNHLYGAVTDAAGNVYVADNLNYVIRKITPAGAVSTFAGSGTQGNVNGTGTGASFGGPVALTIDGSGNLYVSDYQVSIDNYLLKKITPSGVVSTIMTAPAKTFAMAVDAQNNLYTAGDPYNQVYKITPAGVVTNITSGGSFNGITGIAVDKSGTVYLADRNNNQIKKITTAGVVSVLAGSGAVGYADGTGSGAIFQNPNGVVLDASGNVYVSDQNVYTGGQVTSALIRKITPQGVVTTIAGKMGGPLTGDGVGAAAGLVDMVCLTIDANGNMYSTETNAVRKIILTGYTISPALPSGLNFDGTTGIISGTPTAPSPATNYTITGFNVAGGSVATVNITVVGAPCITYNTPQVYTVNNAIAPLVPTNNCGAVPASTYGKVSTLAGSGTAGFSNNTNGALATFNHLYGAVTDAAGNVYVADNLNYVIRKITPAGAVSTFAGSGTQGNVNANGKSASFGGQVGLTIDNLGNLFVLDYQRSIDNYLLKKITPGGDVSTIMTIQGSAMAVDAQNNIYETGNTYNQVFKISPSGVVTEITGNGGFNGPTGIAVDKSGNVYIADRNNNQIKKMTPAGVWSVLAGSGAVGYADGTGTGAVFQNPSSVVVDASGNVYVADQNVYTGGQVTSALIRKITPQGVVTTIAGKMGGPLTGDGVGAAAGLVDMVCLTIDANGNMYTTETNAVRKIVLTGYTISPALPSGLNFDSTTGIISGTPTTASPATNYTITGFNVAGGSAATVNIKVSGLPCASYIGSQTYTINTAISPVLPTNTCGIIPATTYGLVSTLAGSGSLGSANGQGKAASFNFITSVATDSKGNVYVADSRNNQVRMITPGGLVSLFAGSPTGTAGYVNSAAGGAKSAALFNGPIGLTIDSKDNVYVADYLNNVVRKIAQDGTVTTFAVGFYGPYSLAADASDNIYVADAGNSRIVKVSPAGVNTILGGGSAAGFVYPIGVAVDGKGNVYVADQNANQIKKIDQTKTGVAAVSVYAGTGSVGATNGASTTATFNNPCGVATDGSGNVYVTDSGNALIRIISTTGQVSTVAGNYNASSVDGVGTAASFSQPLSVSPDGKGNLYVIDGGNQQVRKIIITGYTITPALPKGLLFDSPTGTISGTPTVTSGTTNYTITGYNSAGSNAVPITITINSATAKTAALVQPQEELTVNTSPYPMPFTSSVNINLGSTEIANLTVQIFNTGNGTLVYNKQFTSQSGILTLDVSNLTKGFYGLHLIYNNNHKIYKIFK